MNLSRKFIHLSPTIKQSRQCLHSCRLVHISKSTRASGVEKIVRSSQRKRERQSGYSRQTGPPQASYPRADTAALPITGAPTGSVISGRIPTLRLKVAIRLSRQHSSKSSSSYVAFTSSGLGHTPYERSLDADRSFAGSRTPLSGQMIACARRPCQLIARQSRC